MPDEQLHFDLGGWSASQARETPLAQVHPETCGSCKHFEPELAVRSRKPEGYCLADYNKPRLATDKPCNKWRPNQAAPESEPRSKRVQNGRG